MRKLFIAIGMFFALNFGTRAQTATRAVDFPLDPGRKHVYDSLFNANDWRKSWRSMTGEKVNADSLFGKDWLSKMLKVGDQMPDLELGTVINNTTGKTRFSDFKGKLVILDFWSTGCKSCIASFPKMKQLQEKFGDKIQIILVNTFETQEEIKKRMGKNIAKIPNLPSMVNAKYIFPYFPSIGVPHHVWIDQYGIIRVLGGLENTYSEKIKDLLDGKTIISYQSESATKPGFNDTIPYHKLIGKSIIPGVYDSFFTSFNFDYSPHGAKGTDSLGNVVRNTFINTSIVDLYINSLRNRMNLVTKHILVNPYYILFEVKDSARYNLSSSFIDTAIIKSTFCYEQVYPKGITEEQSKKMMLEDLNAYFGKQYGTYGRMETRLLPGYVIISGPEKNDKSLYSKIKDFKETPITRNSKAYIHYTATSLSYLVDRYLRQELFSKKKMLINESGIDPNKDIDIEIPVNASLADIKQALKPYGVDIIEKNTEMEVLVISDTKAK